MMSQMPSAVIVSLSGPPTKAWHSGQSASPKKSTRTFCGVAATEAVSKGDCEHHLAAFWLD